MTGINNKLKEREEVCQNERTHTEAYKSLNEEVSQQLTEGKRRMWQSKVLEPKGTNEVWAGAEKLHRQAQQKHPHHHRQRQSKCESTSKVQCFHEHA